MKKHGIILFGIIAASACIYISGCSESSNPQNGGSSTVQPIDLLPASGEISGWDKGNSPGDFGEAENLQELTDLINGGAEIYIQYGFVAGVEQWYDGTIGSAPAKTRLFIADQGDSSNAAALFGDSEVVNSNLPTWQAGDEAAYDSSLPFQVEVFVRKDRFFTWVIVDKGNDPDTALLTAQEFALTVVNDIEE